jgi:hypothetical protein
MKQTSPRRALPGAPTPRPPATSKCAPAAKKRSTTRRRLPTAPTTPVSILPIVAAPALSPAAAAVPTPTAAGSHVVPPSPTPSQQTLCGMRARHDPKKQCGSLSVAGGERCAKHTCQAAGCFKSARGVCDSCQASSAVDSDTPAAEDGHDHALQDLDVEDSWGADITSVTSVVWLGSGVLSGSASTEVEIVHAAGSSHTRHTPPSVLKPEPSSSSSDHPPCATKVHVAL